MVEEEKKPSLQRLFVVCGRDRKEKEVRELFSSYGSIRFIHVALDRSHKSRGFAFLEYEDITSAKKAIEELHLKTLSDGHVLKVTFAKEKQQQQQQQQLEYRPKDKRLNQKRTLLPTPAISTEFKAKTQGLDHIHIKSPASDSIKVMSKDKLVRYNSDVLQVMEAMLKILDAEATTLPKSSSLRGLVLKAEVDSPDVLASCIDSVSLGTSRVTNVSTGSRVKCPHIPKENRSDRNERSNVAPMQSQRKRTGDFDEAEGKGHTRSSSLLRKEVLSSTTSNTKAKKHRLVRGSSTDRPTSHQHSNSNRNSPLVPLSAQAPTRLSSNQLLVNQPYCSSSHRVDQTRLFVIASYSFTRQELEAMFQVYGEFERVDIIKSFGKCKTMAYVSYSNPILASQVLEAFQEEEQPSTTGEFFKVSMAEPTSTISKPKKELEEDEERAERSKRKKPLERLWLLLHYDPQIGNELLSSHMAIYEGMEFVDIKVMKNSSQRIPKGVAFAKFETQVSAKEAASRLHQLQLPIGSGQVIRVVALLENPKDNSWCSVVSPSPGLSSLTGLYSPHAQHSEDFDLHAVETQFADMMRTEQEVVDMGLQGTKRLHLSQPHHMQQQQLLHQYHHYPPTYPDVGYGVYPPHLGAPIFFPPIGAGPPHHHPPPPGYYHMSPDVGGEMAVFPHTSGSSHGHFYPSSGQSHQPPLPPMHHISMGSEYFVSEEDEVEAEDEVEQEEEPIWEPEEQKSSSSKISSVREGSKVAVSCSRPLMLSAVMEAFDEVEGVLGLKKIDAKDYPEDSSHIPAHIIVEFSSHLQAQEAVKILDGSMCEGQKLRVVMYEDSRTSSHRLPPPPPVNSIKQKMVHRTISSSSNDSNNGRAKSGASSNSSSRSSSSSAHQDGRRKRQRVDPRIQKSQKPRN